MSVLILTYVSGYSRGVLSSSDPHQKPWGLSPDGTYTLLCVTWKSRDHPSLTRTRVVSLLYKTVLLEVKGWSAGRQGTTIFRDPGTETESRLTPGGGTIVSSSVTTILQCYLEPLKQRRGHLKGPYNEVLNLDKTQKENSTRRHWEIEFEWPLHLDVQTGNFNINTT